MDHFALWILGRQPSIQMEPHWTDALYGVRYLWVKILIQKMEANPIRCTFIDIRTDSFETLFTKVYEDKRYVVYKNPKSFPLAYGTNVLVRNIKFASRFTNQNTSRIQLRASKS